MSGPSHRPDAARRRPLERLRRLLQALPEGGSVTLSKAGLAQLLGETGHGDGRPEDDLAVDLTVAEVAEKLDRAESTVRGWCAREVIPEAYKLRGREWRIPRAALHRFQKREAEGRSDARPALGRGEEVSLSAWREHRHG